MFKISNYLIRTPEGEKLSTTVTAAGTQCAIVYACFHSNHVDTAEQEKHKQSQQQELGSGTIVDAAFNFKRAKMESLNYIPRHSSLNLQLSKKSLHKEPQQKTC